MDPHQAQLDSDRRPPAELSAEEWYTVHTVVNGLTFPGLGERVSRDEAKALLINTYAAATYLGGTGELVPVLREKIARDCDGLVKAWTLQDNSLAGQPQFWKDVFRLTIYSYLFLEASEGGRPALTALQRHASRCADRLVDTYKRYGVLAGAVLDEAVNRMASSEYLDSDLPMTDGDLRVIARTLSLALIAAAAAPGFDEEMRSLILEDLPPGGGWHPFRDDPPCDLKDKADRFAQMNLHENFHIRITRLLEKGERAPDPGTVAA